MATTIRPELTPKNKYWIEKHRYYELKHYCLQYPDWQKAYATIDGLNRWYTDFAIRAKGVLPGDPTSTSVEMRSRYLDKMKAVEQAAIEADPDLASYILKAVTEGLSYPVLKSRLNIPCSRDTYYDRYRRFFWLLDQKRV